MPARQVFSVFVYALRTGIQWKTLLGELGPASAVQASALHKHIQDWQKAGFFLKLWQAGLAEYDGMEGIAWEWQSIGRTMGRAPLAIE
jgi:transposase